MANVGKISSDFGVGGFGDSIPLASIGKSVNLSGGCDVHVGRALFGMYANYGLGKSAFSSGDTSMSISPGYGVGARIGWMPKETWLVYMSGGLNWSNVKLKNNLMETENSTRGYKLGLGTEIQLTKPVWLRLEASGTRFDATNLNDGVNTTRVVPTMYGVGASIVYKF
jgi:opacity protein-like surface antigen